MAVKILLKLAMVALISAGVASVPVPAAAISLKDASGAPLPIGTPVTATGPIDLTVAGILRRACTISVDGTITAANVITFTTHTPGFVSSCAGDLNPNFDMNFLSSLSVQVSSINVGPCNMPFINFAWNNSASKASISSMTSGGICYIHAGSYLIISPFARI